MTRDPIRLYFTGKYPNRGPALSRGPADRCPTCGEPGEPIRAPLHDYYACDGGHSWQIAKPAPSAYRYFDATYKAEAAKPTAEYWREARETCEGGSEK